MHEKGLVSQVKKINANSDAAKAQLEIVMNNLSFPCMYQWNNLAHEKMIYVVQKFSTPTGLLGPSLKKN